KEAETIGLSSFAHSGAYAAGSVFSFLYGHDEISYALTFAIDCHCHSSDGRPGRPACCDTSSRPKGFSACPRHRNQDSSGWATPWSVRSGVKVDCAFKPSPAAPRVKKFKHPREGIPRH